MVCYFRLADLADSHTEPNYTNEYRETSMLIRLRARFLSSTRIVIHDSINQYTWNIRSRLLGWTPPSCGQHTQRADGCMTRKHGYILANGLSARDSGGSAICVSGQRA